MSHAALAGDGRRILSSALSAEDTRAESKQDDTRDHHDHGGLASLPPDTSSPVPLPAALCVLSVLGPLCYEVHSSLESPTKSVLYAAVRTVEEDDNDHDGVHDGVGAKLASPPRPPRRFEDALRREEVVVPLIRTVTAIVEGELSIHDYRVCVEAWPRRNPPWGSPPPEPSAAMEAQACSIGWIVEVYVRRVPGRRQTCDLHGTLDAPLLTLYPFLATQGIVSTHTRQDTRALPPGSDLVPLLRYHSLTHLT